MHAIEQFKQAMQGAGLPPPEIIHPDGHIHRFSANGKRGDKAGWYSFHADGIPAHRRFFRCCGKPKGARINSLKFFFH